MKQWYEELFDHSAGSYEEEEFTKGTSGEVDFIEAEIRYDTSKKILDIGCGTGRHSIELASRGYDVVGIDLSEAMLKKARQRAIQAGVTVEFLRQDARTLHVETPFDVVMMVCEGGFPLMETDEMNYQILRSAASALKPGGKLILTTLNGLFPLFHSIRDFVNQGTTGVSRANTFDLLTFRDHSTYEFVDDEGKTRRLQCSERYYVPSEMHWLLTSLGFQNITICGCDIGKWSRDLPLTTDHFEMLIVAEK
ncbi:MAG: class I SAM-dependent methyltransferase [Ignavibacteria bacterium]|nr:class I SAM-dependent methyltransferase [Ignavibacteria bacterium]